MSTRMNLPRTLAVAPALFVLSGLIAALILYNQTHTIICIPWLSGCIGVSELGVADPLSFVYRAGLLPGAMLLAFWWYAVRSWIAEVEPGTENDYSASLTAFGFAAAVCLIIAVSLLRPEPGMLLWRVHGIFLAGFTGIQLFLQLRLVLRQWRWRKDGILNTPSLWLRGLLVVLQLLLLPAMLVGWLMDLTPLVNQAEWWLASLMMLFCLASYLDWGRYHLTLDA